MILHPGEERVGLYPAKRQAPVAQWIEHLITVQKVGGSSPSGRAAAPLGAIHRWGFCISTKHSFGSAFFMPIRLWRAVAGPANWFPVRSETTVARQWGVPDWRCDGTRPARFHPSRPETKFALHTPPTPHPRKTSPSTAPSSALPRKSSPCKRKKADFGVF